MRNLYKIYQEENVNENTFSSAIVVASSEFQAKRIHPSSIAQEDGAIVVFNLWTRKWELINKENEVLYEFENTDDTWVDISKVKVEYLGEYKEDIPNEKIIIVSTL